MGPFDKHQFNVMTIEHNDAPERTEMQALLVTHGYRRVFEEIARLMTGICTIHLSRQSPGSAASRVPSP
jgi:hypothetical protein